MTAPATFLIWSAWIGLTLVVLAVALTFYRLARGPTVADRIVALDMMTTAIVVFCAMLAVLEGITAYLDVGIALALVSFLSVVALARFLERNQKGDGR